MNIICRVSPLKFMAKWTTDWTFQGRRLAPQGSRICPNQHITDPKRKPQLLAQEVTGKPTNKGPTAAWVVLVVLFHSYGNSMKYVTERIHPRCHGRVSPRSCSTGNVHIFRSIKRRETDHPRLPRIDADTMYLWACACGIVPQFHDSNTPEQRDPPSPGKKKAHASC